MNVNTLIRRNNWILRSYAVILLLFLGGIASLRAQIGVDFNQGNTSGTVNVTAFQEIYQDVGDLVPVEQSSLHLALNGFFWTSSRMSTRFGLSAGLPLLGVDDLTDTVIADQSLYFYVGEFALRFTLLKVNSIAMMLGVLLGFSEGHTGDLFLFNSQANSAYLQTSLGVEFEVALALGLEHLLYFRLKVPFSTYNAVAQRDLEWGFYPRQGSAELAFLFHKGPSFGLSKAARTVYFGPFYRFDARVLSLTTPTFILSHTIGVTYYTKPPF